MCRLVRTRSAVAGSSSSACTASYCACHAPTGSSSTLGPAGSCMPPPAARNDGNHSVRWRTTSRAVHSATGEGTSHDRVPRTRSVNTRPISRCRSAGWSDSAIGEYPLELRVALVDPDLHATLEPCVPAFKTVHKRLRAQPGAAVTEVLEPQRLQGHTVGIALVGERLNDAVRPDLVEAATERVFLPVAGGHEPPAAAGARVPLLDACLQGARADPLREQLGIGVRPQQLLGRTRELAGHANDRHVRVSLDRGFGDGAHAALPFSSSLRVWVAYRCERTASR